MNTKVEEALGVLDAFARCTQSQVCCGNTVGGGMDENGNGEPPSCCGSPLADDDLLEAAGTLAAHIAQQDATIARLERGLATIRDSTFRNATTLRGMADYTLTQEKSP